MIDATLRRTFDLSRAGEKCIHAILEGLRVDGENVRGQAFDADSGVLEVQLTRLEAGDHVEGFVARMKQVHRFIGRKILRSNHAESFAVRDIDAGLASSRDIHIFSEGLVGLRGQLLELLRFFEREFARLARELEAEEHYYPVMMPGEVLAELGYLAHFPQHVTFCAHLPGDLPALEAVASAAKNEGGISLEVLGERLEPPRHFLAPAVCLPCYRQLRDVVLEPGRVRVLTMQNHVFRYEGANFSPLRRGWDFTVRDVVFFGSNQALIELREEVMERALELCRELDLEVTIELANDPFFLEASRDKAIYQRMGDVKYELLFPMPHRQQPLAASSFNLHRDYYTSIYGTRLADGSPAESACMGFGLERWLYGFLSQKGLDPAGWPRRVTDTFG